MNTISDRADISRILMQMRDVQSQMPNGAIDGPRTDLGIDSLDGLRQVSDTQETGFGDMLKQAVDAVNEAQTKSGDLQTAYVMGDEGVDLTEVMIQMQKSSIAFEAMTQVRNRFVSAYQDIMNMPI